MRISFPFFVFGYLILGGNASPTAAPTFYDNQGDLCKDDLLKEGRTRMIKPSVANDGRIGPIRQIGTSGKSYSTNREHYVIGYPNEKKHKKRSKKKTARSSDYVYVFLHGTTSSPYRHSCHLNAIASSGRVVVGLSYATLNAPDGARNIMCGNEPDTAQCLTDHHIQAIVGGDFRGDLWTATDPQDSVTGRLGLLMKHLDHEHPNEGWNHFYHEDSDTSHPSPVWNNIVISGHSQGAGHAAYMAQMHKLAGASLYSGPQDDCIGCPKNTKLWVDDPFKTYAITAMAHGDSAIEYEPLIGSMKDNWTRMAATGTISWSDKSESLEVTDVGYGFEDDYDVCSAPVVTFVTPAATSTCGRAGHCSISVDSDTPLITRTTGEFVSIYSLYVWPVVADATKCN